MNRPKREVKAPKRLIEDDEPVAKKPVKRTLNLDVSYNKSDVNVDNIVKDTKLKTPKNTKRVINVKLDNNPSVDVDEIVKNTKLPKSKKEKEPVRTLNLDLSDVPPSDDFKFSKDFGEYNNKFWVTYFYTPKDNITKLYSKAVEEIADVLPPNFQLYEDTPSAFGVANLELKEQYKKPIKRTPLLSKLLNRDYETATSKSDNNIGASIKFFRNNLPSFKRYANDDDISWVVNQHRLLIAELMEYFANQKRLGKNPRTATIKTKVNAITRIFRIAFDTKNYELYDKYSGLVIFLGSHFEDDEFDNELSEIEAKKFITFDIVLDKQKELQKQFELIKNKKTKQAYDLNQDLLLISLYSLIPPLRNEVKTLKFTSQSQNKEDWIYLRSDGNVILDLNEEKKRHDAIYFNLTNDSPELAKLLKESYELYPRVPLFTPYKTYPDVSKQATVQSVSDRLTSIFAFTGKMVSVNTFRSSFVSWANSEAIKHGRQLSVKDKEKIALKMRTSRKYLDESYLKIIPILKAESQEPQQPKVIQVVPVKEPVSAYQQQLTRNKRYYEENKEKVLKKQKEYKDSRPTFDKSRVRMLHYLNNDSDYYNRMKDATKKKYNFKKENGRWV